mgnify:FL=1|jgi:hypothetical protein|tara:strand:+ start:233 stop:451 length:219 start_codon:yes stop_codon:yes gene_type:complete
MKKERKMDINEIKKAIIEASNKYDKEQIRLARQKKLRLAQEIEWFSSIEHREPTSENYFRGNYNKGIIRQQQ